MIIKFIKISFLILFTFFLLFLLLELFARFVIKQPYYAFPEGYFINNEFYGYELAKSFNGSYSQPEFTISINTNSDGLRDIEHTENNNCYKILALGDSFTFGIGVELDDTYLRLLEKKLNEDTETKRYSIVKAGIVGYSTYNERIYLEKKGLNYNPDMVIVQFWWDDLGIDRITYLADTGFLTTGKIINFAHFRLFLNRYFRSYAFLRTIFTRRFNRSLFAFRPKTNLENKEALKEKFNISLKELKKIESICKQNNIPLLFILVPTKEFTSSKIELENEWKSFCEFLNRNDINYIDFMPILKNAVTSGDNPFFRVDPHFNEKGHKLVADELYEYLSSMSY